MIWAALMARGSLIMFSALLMLTCLPFSGRFKPYTRRMGTGLIVALCALVIVSIMACGVWAQRNPDPNYRAEDDHQ